MPRCRYYLCTNIAISSSQDLDSIASRLKSVPGLNARVRSLRLTLHNKSPSEQTWVCVVPLRLPRLPNLRRLEFAGLDLSMQNPQSNRLFSLFNCTRNPGFALCFFFEHGDMGTQYSQIARLASALRPGYLYIHRGPHQIRLLEDLLPDIPQMQPMTSRMDFTLDGTPKQLAKILFRWRFPVRTLCIAMFVSSRMTNAELAASRAVWQCISRIFMDSPLLECIKVGIHGVGEFRIRLNKARKTRGTPFARFHRRFLM